MTKEKKSFYKTFFALYIALVCQNVITLSVNLMDNIMLGAYGESALSGVAAVNQVQFVFQQLIMALGDGLVILCSQYWGKKNVKAMKRIMAAAMRSAVVIAILLFIAASLCPIQILKIFSTDEEIIREGVRYLGIIRFTYLFFAITQILLASLRSTAVVKIASVLSLVTLGINCGINYVLIFGNFGFPRMGVEGAAIGTLTARVVEVVILVLYIWKKEKNIHLQVRDFFHMDSIMTKDYLKVTLPIAVLSGLWGLNTALQTVILGHMTSAAIAANSAASNLFLMVKSTAVGAASATGIMIGKTIGQGDLERAGIYSKRLQKLFVVIGVMSGSILFFLRIPVLSLYKLSPEAMELANTFLMILSVVCMTMSYQMPTNNGIIRGGGNTMFVIKMDLISIWGIVIPLSFIMAFVVKASPVVVVCCLNADQIFKCIPAFLEANYGNWIRKLTRD